MGKTRDDWRKAIRIVCMTRHAKTCTVLENCNGNYCNNPSCHRSGEQAELVIDEIDNNRHNHDPDNQQLLCHSCNQKKSPKHLRVKRNTGSAGVREKMAVADEMTVDAEARQEAKDSNPQIEISEQMKHAYRTWLAKNTLRDNGVTVNEAIYEAAYDLDINPVTIRRYLGMLVTANAPYKKEKGMRQDPDGRTRAYTFIKRKDEEKIVISDDDQKRLAEQLATAAIRNKAATKERQEQQAQPVAPVPTVAALPKKDDRPFYIM